jgi:hypothetical protein
MSSRPPQSRTKEWPRHRLERFRGWWSGPNREGEAPAELSGPRLDRLGGSLALPEPASSTVADYLVRSQRMSQTEAAPVLEASGRTLNRRRNRPLHLLAARLGDLCPGEEDPAAA